MRSERATAAVPPTKQHLKKPEATSEAPVRLKIADRPVLNRLDRLVDLTFTLLKEAEALARDKAFSDESARIQVLNFSEGIDFYGEVERFEINLIRLALDQTRGNQAKAARLLKIKATTLNSKMKLYGIQP